MSLDRFLLRGGRKESEADLEAQRDRESDEICSLTGGGDAQPPTASGVGLGSHYDFPTEAARNLDVVASSNITTTDYRLKLAKYGMLGGAGMQRPH